MDIFTSDFISSLMVGAYKREVIKKEKQLKKKKAENRL